MGLFIDIRTIDHKIHRYPSVGDYFVGANGRIMIQVSNLGNWKEEILIALHELVEYALVLDRGISIEEIDLWDINFKGEGEPGDDSKSPYHKEHIFATNIEREMALALGVSWSDYENNINKLFKEEGQ